jgi:hypothetical protein
MIMSRKAQTWSTDALVGVALFIIAAILVYYLLGPVKDREQQKNIEDDSKKIPNSLGSDQNFTSTFIYNSKVDEAKLIGVSNLSYESLKNNLGVSSDFCIYFEDENGNLVPIGDKQGLGSPVANISGKSCNATIG